MQKRRIAITGLGAAAREIHLPAYRGIPEIELVGGYDPDPESRSVSFQRYGSLEQMLSTAAPDILVVAGPPDSHFESTRQGLLAGCHVLCEKPFMNTLQEAETIIGLARALGRQVVVNNQFRFMNIHRRARELIGKADFGDLLFLSAHQTFYTTRQTESGWRGREMRRTCKDFGIHVLDLCRFFFGEEPASVYARMPRPEKSGGPDLLNLIQLEFSGDRMAHITLDRLSRGRHRYLDIRLDGTSGCVETHLGGGFSICAGIRGRSRRPFLQTDLSMGGKARLFHGERYRKIASDPLDVFAAATRRLMRAFLNSLEEGSVPPCHASDNKGSLALMQAAYESEEKKRSVVPRGKAGQ
ncbi:MAG: Gfo/Idh/MocA family protein [Acidobacteriota bacterium]